MNTLRRPPTHPGELLTEVVFPALNLDFQAAASQITLDKQRFRDFLDGKADLNDREAAEVGKAFHVPPHLILNMQKSRADYFKTITP